MNYFINIRNGLFPALSQSMILRTLLLLSFCFSSHATEYQSKEALLKEVFSTPPKAKILWLKKKLQQQVSDILQHKPGFLRTRYWQTREQTVWIIDEIGKTKPITTAIVIKDKKIKSIKVLEFRESRGWEVKHDFFTNQFKQNALNPDLNLTHPIDGISGATLSVRALTKVARLALLFENQIRHEE